MTKQLLLIPILASSCLLASASPDRVVGIYVHQHWPYHHPYAARTWTLDDWQGFADGLKRLGFNTVMIWPVLETIPEPMTPSDRASLKKHGRVIDLLHKNGMQAWIALCPNVVPNDAEAAKAAFERRHFFYCDRRVDPRDEHAVRKMMARRERLMRYLRKADGVAVIDSDPGGYPGSTNEDFVRLLGEHRKLLDHLRPGIELIYWMHVGWESYSKHYATGAWFPGDEKEHSDALQKLMVLNPEPWAVANGLPYAEKLRISGRVIMFNYGRIEPEPSFPITGFSPQAAWEAGRASGPRGVMGNAQTHCVQLPNLFAFAQGTRGGSITESDFARFGNELIPGAGEQMLRAWKALAGADVVSMRGALSEVEKLKLRKLTAGPLKGLLFGSPERFWRDLTMMLSMKIAAREFIDNPDKAHLPGFIAAAEHWQQQHGYENRWAWPGVAEALHKLDDPGINAALKPALKAPTPFERVAEELAVTETETVRLLAAMKVCLKAK